MKKMESRDFTTDKDALSSGEVAALLAAFFLNRPAAGQAPYTTFKDQWTALYGIGRYNPAFDHLWRAIDIVVTEQPQLVLAAHEAVRDVLLAVVATGAWSICKKVRPEDITLLCDSNT